MNKLDRLYIDDEDKELYEKIRNEIFKNKDNKDLFLFAMAKGFKVHKRSPLQKKFGFVRTEYLLPQDRALLNAIAIYEKGSEDVLLNEEEVFQIAEEYAHYGIQILKGELETSQFGSFDKKLEKELFELFQGLALDKNGEENPLS